VATVRTATNGKSAKAKGNRKRPAAKKPKAKARAKAKSGPSIFERLIALGGGRSGEIAGVLALGASIFFILSLLSLQLGDGLMMGPFGRSFAVLGYSVFGIGAHLAAAGAALVSVRLLMERETIAKSSHVLGVSLGLLSLAVLMHLALDSYRIAGYGPGGLLGQKIAELFVGLVSTAGTALVASVCLLVSIVIATPLRMRSLLVFFGGASKTVGQGAYTGARRVGQDAAKFSGEVIRAVLPERDHDEYLDEDYEDEYADYDDEEDLEEDASAEDPPIIDARSGPVPVPTDADADDTEKVDASHMEAVAEEAANATKKPSKKTKKPRKKTHTLAGVGEVIASGPAEEDSEAEPEESEEEEVAEVKPTAKEAAAAAKKARAEAEAAKAAEPVIVESQFQAANAQEMKKKEAEAEENRLDFIKLHDGEYELPSLDFLAFDENRDAGIDRGAMLELSAKLVTTLENYGVKGHVAAIRPGPVVTMYEFAPAAGTRLNKIVNLSDDLAMSLEAMKVRIVAPIPGKAAVGIEVPNKKTEMVYLKEIIADEGFRDDKIRLPMSLGKDIEGAPVSVDLAKMPHLMVAGTTGSGKSVSVNSMITSLLYSRSPDEVRMIMIDPKMLELSIYEGIPHLLLPVVTDPKKANLALRWAVDEMERRYGLLAKMGVRDIKSYNAKMEKKQAQWNAGKLQRIADHAKKLADAGDFDEVETTEVRQGELDFDDTSNCEPEKPLPFIVVVIDEFADLMMCAPKEVETSVARIAQKARAAGIHLILATQRPSVDVITGLIKANFPSRIAFRVSSKVDSRTVLDQSGAENLLGSGDMLFSDRGAAPVRLHGCFVDEEEIHQVVSFLKTQGKPVYNLDIIKPREEEEDEGEDGGEGSEPRDELYDKAVNIVAEAQRVSVSYLQRRLSVGYNRSAKLVERMEREGVVSSPDNKKQREVLIAAA
jgi:S-DNA-T family DNA segregation ATPase FtsK/SpoIIIE